MRFKFILLFIVYLVLHLSAEGLSGLYNVYYHSSSNGNVILYSGTIYFKDDGRYDLSIKTDNDYQKMGFDEEKISLSGSSKYYIESGSWDYEMKNSLPYLKFLSDDGASICPLSGILYYDDYLVMYNNRNEIIFESYKKSNIDNALPWIENVNASSELNEKGYTYSSSNVSITQVSDGTRNLPWIEAEEGYGIDSWIEININSLGIPVSYFLISNGFVDFSRPHLFSDNSRVKTIEIICEEGNLRFDVELSDNSQFQKVEIPDSFDLDSSTYRFVIKDVYPGKKWDDTCINLIVPKGDIPF